MKLPITDQFLWDIVRFLDHTEDTFSHMLHPPRSWGQFYISVDDPVYRKYHKMLKSERFKKLVYHLKRNNYIKSKNLQGKKAIIITKRGISKVIKASFKTIDKKKRKDGKWIMIIFDLPKNYEKSRILLRSILENLGYKMFQHSVWITPFDVVENTEDLLQHYSLDSYVKIFLIEAIE